MMRYGVTRAVLLIFNFAIKFPSFKYGQRYFVYGCLGNLLERDHWKLHHHPQLAPVYFCAPLGLFLIMKRYHTLLNRRLTHNERNSLPFSNIDDNGHNIAYDQGKFILIDYGNADWFYDLPTLWE